MYLNEFSKMSDIKDGFFYNPCDYHSEVKEVKRSKSGGFIFPEVESLSSEKLLVERSVDDLAGTILEHEEDLPEIFAEALEPAGPAIELDLDNLESDVFLAFLQPLVISKKELSDLNFQEELIFNYFPKRQIGDATITVSKKYNGSLLVSFFSRFVDFNIEHKFTIVSAVDLTLRTDEEIRINEERVIEDDEHIDGIFTQEKVTLKDPKISFCYGNDKEGPPPREPPQYQKKTCFIGRDGRMHFSHFTCQVNKSAYRTKRKFTSDNSKMIISEGANLLLLRKMAIASFVGEFPAKGILPDGDICDFQYKSNDIKLMSVQNEVFPVKTIERVIICSNGYSETIKSFMTPKGQIIRMDWTESKYKLHCDPRIKLDPGRRWTKEDIPLESKIHENYCLNAEYKLAKELYSSELRSYYEGNPQIEEVVSFIVKYVINEKPSDVLSAVRHAFDTLV